MGLIPHAGSIPPPHTMPLSPDTRPKPDATASRAFGEFSVLIECCAENAKMQDYVSRSLLAGTSKQPHMFSQQSLMDQVRSMRVDDLAGVVRCV
jgi:hypothetical protein